MKLPGKIIDANVILRFFLEDDEKQFIKAKAFISQLELAQETALVTEIVFAEVVWVLNKVYSIPRAEISDKFMKLLNYKGIKTVFDKRLFADSLKLYAEHSMDIQDTFLSVLAKANACKVVTFDTLGSMIPSSDRTSIPPMPDIFRSSSTVSGLSLLKTLSAFSPLCASQTWKPSSSSTPFITALSSSSSSTISIFAMGLIPLFTDRPYKNKKRRAIKASLINILFS